MPDTKSVVFAYSGDTERKTGPDQGIASGRHFSIALAISSDSGRGINFACFVFLGLRIFTSFGGGRPLRRDAWNLLQTTSSTRHGSEV